jgi:hypothetical protein
MLTLGQLNLGRMNPKGIVSHDVNVDFFSEIEHCLRLSIAFDLLWNLRCAQT